LDGSGEFHVNEADLPEDLVKELDKCREARDEIEVVVLQLESEAQDLAELSVEANEKSIAVTAKISEVVGQIAQIELDEEEGEKELKAAKKALKKALKKQKKKQAKLEDPTLASTSEEESPTLVSEEAEASASADAQSKTDSELETEEGRKTSDDSSAAADADTVRGEGEGETKEKESVVVKKDDTTQTDSAAASLHEELLNEDATLQQQVQSLETQLKAQASRVASDAEEARDWMEPPADKRGVTEDYDSIFEDSAEEKQAQMELNQSKLETLERDFEEIKKLDQNVCDWKDQLVSLAQLKVNVQTELEQLESKLEELVQYALSCDQKASEAMEGVEKAVSAEMAAEARLEECEQKAEDLIKDMIKQKKQEKMRIASFGETESDLFEDERGSSDTKKKKESGSFSEDDLWAEAHDAMQKKKEKVEKQVKNLVDEATELLEEAASIADKEGKEDAAAAPSSSLETETKTKAAADKKKKVILDAEPVAASSPSSSVEEAVNEKKEEKVESEAEVAEVAESSSLAIRRISNLKQAAAKRNVFANPTVRKGLGAVVLALSLGLAGRLAYTRGYVTKATQVVQTQVINRIRPEKKEKPLTRREKRALKKAKAVEHEEHGGESGMLDTLWLLATCVVVVPVIAKIPGGSPVLGFLLGGALVGPNALGIINNVNAVKHIAELGVIFLLFNIGLELSFERLQAMQKYVFGLGFTQVVLTMLIAVWLGVSVLGLSGPGATILAAAMSLSSTAVALQVLQDRGEASSRHGRAAFSVLLFQDLAVVVFLMLTPLLAQSQSSQAVGGQEQVKMFLMSIGQAIVKACVAIAAIIFGGRLAFRPIYKRIAKTGNAEIFAATTLLVVLGTSMLTQKFGLSMELGAFIAGLLLAETEYALQIESDIAPYKGLLLGLFFMTVGMEFSMTLLIQQWRAILATMAVIILGKTAVVAFSGPLFGLGRMASIRAGLMLAPGGEFAFVLLGEAAAKAILAGALCSQMYLVVALGMALTPMLATVGNWMDDKFESKDVLKLQPSEGEVDDLRGHVIVAGFGRVGQMICQLLSERMIPFVALDVRSDRVAKGRDMEMPVYFGDSGSSAVLHSLGASKASCAVVVLDTPGSNYRCVWTIKKHYPNVKVYVRARDVQHGLNLERAGASAVVPETLEPSLQLAAAVLQEMQMPPDEVAMAIDDYRRKHIGELSELAYASGSSLGYGYTEKKAKEEKAKESAKEGVKAT
jgi:monovalent cation:proton antiporter-2 (CPA2) family protein